MSVKSMVLAGALATAFVLPAGALAQVGQSSSGLPRALPSRPAPELPPPDRIGPHEQAPEADIPAEVLPPGPLQAPRPRLRNSLPNARGPAVEVGDLGSVEGPVAGLMDDTNGGLGAGMWQGIDRSTAAAMLKGMPSSPPSETARLLERKLLLTSAPPPAGSSDGSFNALRLTKLLDAGLVDEAADLALKISAPNNPEMTRAQANALALAGRYEICSDITESRLDSAEPFWAELRVYCYAMSKDLAAFDLTRSVIEDQGIVDPAFLVLLDGIVASKGKAPDSIRLPDSLQLMLFQKLKLPIPAEMEAALGLPASLAIVASKETPKALRVASAEKALRAGVLRTPPLVQILDSFTFPPQGFVGAPAIARTEPLMSGLARLRAALQARGAVADTRAELIYTAFEIGQREGVFSQVARLFADDAAAIFPRRDWANWSELMIRGLLLAGQPDAAMRWYEILDLNQPGAGDMANHLALTLSLVAPNVVDPMATEETLLDVRDRLNAVQDPVPQSVIAQATLGFGIFDALRRPMPPGARDEVAPLMREMSTGRRPAPALMQRIERGAAAKARGEVALSVAAALGAEGVRDLAPDIIVRLVRALDRVGLNGEAATLAMEAMLLRPASAG